jgi:hypothetical protein
VANEIQSSRPSLVRPLRTIQILSSLTAIAEVALGLVAIFLYWAFRWQVLESLGLVLLVWAPVVNTLLLGSLLLLQWLTCRTFRSKTTLVAGALLGFAFPVGLLCAWTGSYLFSQCRVKVVNESGTPITRVQIVVSGNQSILNLGTLRPSESRSVTFRGEGESSARLSFQTENGPREADVIGYFEASHCSAVTAVVDPKNEITLR